MCDEMHPAQDTRAWLTLLESSESQLYRGVSHSLRRKFCKKWKLSVWKELLKHFDVRYWILSFTDIVRLENEPEKIDKYRYDVLHGELVDVFCIRVRNISAGNRTRVPNNMSSAIPVSYRNILVWCLLPVSSTGQVQWIWTTLVAIVRYTRFYHWIIRNIHGLLWNTFPHCPSPGRISIFHGVRPCATEVQPQ